jgi:Arc/MetJ family transcription regulator
MKRTTIHLADADRIAIKTIRERYGMDTDSAAIRLALRILATTERLQIPSKNIENIENIENVEVK